MLVPATLYKDEICNELIAHSYTEDMFYYTGSLECYLPKIEPDSDANNCQYAIVDGDKLIVYFEYLVDWYTSCVCCFGLFAFYRNNAIIGLDVYMELERIISDYHIHRVECRMIGGNTVEKHYDNFCKKYHGNKFVLTDAVKDRQGNYHNDVIYEIIFPKEKEFRN